jgi:hypothetical protein
MGQQLIEVARAALNGDGIEDILLFEYCCATHGTLGVGGIRVLTRMSAAGPFEVVVPCHPLIRQSTRPFASGTSHRLQKAGDFER